MTPSPSSSTTVVSTPGKVLIAGGYLVLDQKYRGTVISTSSRFHTVIQEKKAHVANRICVRSPQFVDAEWEYVVKTDGGNLLVNAAETNKSKNKFVHIALQNALALTAEINGVASVTSRLEKGIDVAVLGDNDFYSQRDKLASLNLPRTLASLASIPPFSPTGVVLPNVHKTGLGSSAALITSLVAALLLHFAAIHPSSFAHEQPSEGKLLTHNLAQYVHGLAQGKIGSGFDIAAAVFGSHLYTRFNPTVLEGLMGTDVPRSHPLQPVLAPSNKAWDYEIEPFKLPPSIRIMLADVNAGSDTPSLASKVLKWRSEKPEEALALWTSLDELNQKLAETLMGLSVLHEKNVQEYTYSVKYIATLPAAQWAVVTPLLEEAEKIIIGKFYEVHFITQTIRQKMREMGELANVPIEPPEQTKLLDTCVGLAGVIGGGVPGAGGYDAVWLLVCDPADVEPDIPPSERVERAWNNYKDLDVSPLSTTASEVRGLHIEDIEKVPGLRSAVSSSTN